MIDYPHLALAALRVQDVKKRAFPRLVLCLAMILGGRPIPPVMAETFLPEQGITISGKVTAPSCQAHLNNDTLNFIIGKPQAVTGQSRNSNDGNKQSLVLSLSDCDFNGLGVKFNAQSQVGQPERGVLRRTSDNAISTNYYYTIGPNTSPQEGMEVLSLAQDSPVMVNTSGSDKYFRLNKEEYWFDRDATLKNGGSLNIPFNVSVHLAAGHEGDSPVEDLLDAKFTLQLSYR